MKRIIACLATTITIGILSCMAQEKQCAEIKGSMGNTNIHKIFLTCIDSSLRIVDSCEIRNGKFAFRIRPDKPDIYELYYSNGHYRSPIALEPGCNMGVTVSGNNATTVDVRCGTEEKMMQLLTPALKEYADALDNMRTDGIDDCKDMINEANRKLAARIAQYPRSLAAIYALSSMIGVEDDLFFDVYESSVDTASYTHSHYFKAVQNDYHTRKSNILVGNTAFDFEAKTINGDTFNLSQLRGKYVVLNFWASWCKPCREKNKEIADCLHFLKKEDWVLVSFNVDKEQSAWKEASKNDEITWLNVSNGEGFEGNNILTRYKVSRLPSIFLISPEGVILKQNRPFREIISHN